MKTFLSNLKKDIKDKDLHYSIIATFIIGLIAHAYSYFNIIYSHDSLILYQNDWKWQLSIGRFMHWFIFLIRGNYYVPWLVGFISLVFLSLTVYLVVKIFNFKGKAMITMVAGLLTSNVIYTLVNATYSHDIDIYMISLFFSVLGVYLICKYKCGIWVAPICFVVSMGLYQSFINCSVFLLIVLAIKMIFDGDDLKSVFKTGFKWILSLLFGFLLYYIVFKSLMLILNIDYGECYNSLSKVGKYDSIYQFFETFLITIAAFVKYFFKPVGYNEIISLTINILSIVSIIVMIFLITIKKELNLKKFLLVLLLIYLIPFGINITCFFSKGILHHLMIYSFTFIYILVLYLLGLFNNIKTINVKFKKCFTYLILGMYGLLIFNNFIYSNQTYFIKKLNYQNTLLFSNRIITRLENMENYEVGVTPVVFIGYTDIMPYTTLREGINYEGTGTSYSYALSYYDTFDYLFNRVMNYPMNIDTDYFDDNDYYLRPDLGKMGIYPSKDSIKEIDGTIFIKISEYIKLKNQC